MEDNQVANIKLLDPTQNPFPGRSSFEKPKAPHTIFQIAEFGPVILITFMPRGKPGFNNNVYAYDKSGDLLWIVSSPSLDPTIEDPYIYLAWSDERQCLLLTSWSGSYWDLDANTGHVKYLGSNQR